MSVTFTRTLRLKVRREANAWLNAAAAEVNVVFNYCNETSYNAATRTDNMRKCLSGFDLCNLTAGATQYFDKIGAGTIQSICVHYAQKRRAAGRLKLRWRKARQAWEIPPPVRETSRTSCGRLLCSPWIVATGGEIPRRITL